MFEWLLKGIVLSLVAVLLSLSAPAPSDKSSLLPLSLSPEHYEISLSPKLDLGVFQGTVVITGVGVLNTDRITLHCRSLLFNATRLQDVTEEQDVEVLEFREDTVLQQCRLSLSRRLQVDHEYQLRVQFLGKIGHDGLGLYRDQYQDSGINHDILMTHLQPNFARAVFPCFDEPHYKAQFQLRVSQGDFPTLISNMPISTVSRPHPGLAEDVWVEFEETPQMSPYLLVLVMCDYQPLADSTSNSTVWAPPSRLHEAQLALNVSIAVLDRCERYFGVEHALPKLDHVPVPNLNTVAMENWGAITYKKDFLLWEEGVSTWAQKETISYVICHEIVHQWLGNLVTTSWWNTTWLNEGVTSFYHYYFMDKIEPSWEVMDVMFVTQIHLIFTEESLRNPKPLTNNEHFAQDTISTVAFSASTYLKGAAVMRMVYSLMPPDIFREAIVQYIIDNEYSSVDEDDLWQSIAAVADLPVDLQAVMLAWTHQSGYPLIRVIRPEDGCISVTQEKYLADHKGNARWTIPLTFTTSLELDFNLSRTVWFPEDQDSMRLDVCLKSTDWILFNIKQSGFYRVKYDSITWSLLEDDLRNGNLEDIHAINRAQLINDGFDLAMHGELDWTQALGLSRYLTRETHYLPWFVAVQWLNVLRGHLHLTDTAKPFQRYALSLVENAYSNQSLTGEVGGLLPELHRKLIVEFACSLGHPHCVKAATDTVYLLMSGVHVTARIPLELKPVLLCTAVRHGQPEVWHYVLKQYQTAAENERWKYLSALACTTDKTTLIRVVNDVVDKASFVKSSDERFNLLIELGKQENTLEPLLDLILHRYFEVSTNFEMEMILQLLRSFINRYPTPQEKDKIQQIAILVKHSHNSKQTELMDSILSDINHLNFNSLYEESIREWLNWESDEEVDDDDDYGTRLSISPAPKEEVNQTAFTSTEVMYEIQDEDETEDQAGDEDDKEAEEDEDDKEAEEDEDDTETGEDEDEAGEKEGEEEYKEYEEENSPDDDSEGSGDTNEDDLETKVVRCEESGTCKVSQEGSSSKLSKTPCMGFVILISYIIR